MPEKPVAGEQHGHATGIGLIDDLLVPNGSSGLNDGGSTCLCGLLETVLEWEKCI